MPAGRVRTAAFIFLEFHHHTGNQLLGVGDALVDQLNVHGGLARLPRALAIDAVLADQHQGVGQQIERDRQTSPLPPHLEFVLFEGVLAVVEDGHAL